MKPHNYVSLLTKEGFAPGDKSRHNRRKLRKIKRKAAKAGMSLECYLSTREKDRMWEIVRDNIGKFTVLRRGVFEYSCLIKRTTKKPGKSRCVVLEILGLSDLRGPQPPLVYSDTDMLARGEEIIVRYEMFKRAVFLDHPLDTCGVEDPIDYWVEYCRDAMESADPLDIRYRDAWARYIDSWEKWRRVMTG